MKELEFYQNFKDGSYDIAEDPIGPKRARMLEIVSDALNRDVYRFDWTEKKSQPYHGVFWVEGQEIDLYIYMWSISNGGRNRNRPMEKRIQIQNGANSIGFLRPTTDEQKTLLMGIYENSPTPPIIGAWNATAPVNINHTQKSCQVQVPDLVKGMQNGIHQAVDSRGNVIYTMCPEYLGKYIELVEPSGIMSSVTEDVSRDITRIRVDKRIELRRIASWMEDHADVPEKERTVLLRHRVGHGYFRDLLLPRYEKRCCLCGQDDEHTLVAVNIKHWDDCTEQEKLNVHNGLLMCTSHAKLFDKFLLSFDEDGMLLVSPKLSGEERERLPQDCRIEVSDKMEPFMAWHRSRLAAG